MKINAKFLDFLKSIGTVDGDKLTLSLSTIAEHMTSRTRASESEILNKISVFLGENAGEGSTIKATASALLAAGFPRSAVSLSYWRSPASAACRAIVQLGYVPNVKSVQRDDGSILNTMFFTSKDASEKHLAAHAKLVAAIAEWQSSREDSDDSEDSDPDTGDSGEE